MGHKFICRVAGIDCDHEIQAEDREKVRNEAGEHVKTRHPDRALDQAKIDGYIHHAGRVE